MTKKLWFSVQVLSVLKPSLFDHTTCTCIGTAILDLVLFGPLSIILRGAATSLY